MSRGKKVIRAVGLLSGGLDSTLAAKLMIEQGIEVHAINFTSPFCTCTSKKAGCSAVITAVKELGDIPLKRVSMGDEYLAMVRTPRHGYGSGMNPCIDCRVMKIRMAGEYMKEIDASFLFTGEVLGQRPMSQHRKSIHIIDRESGLDGYILRPLSAQFFPPTVPEKKGWIEREKLLGITGRSRKAQMSLADEKGIKDYPCPAGGCLLTDKHFSERMRDYFRNTNHPRIKDIPLLKIGRHFRLDEFNKVIVARNEQECKRMECLCRSHDHLLAPHSFSGPVVILQGNSLEAAVEKLLFYSKKANQESDLVVHRHMDKERVLPLNILRFETVHHRRAVAQKIALSSVAILPCEKKGRKFPFYLENVHKIDTQWI
jgi:tRNA U34 2-thiouridine synthase MnmA/TrmU